MTEQKTKLNLPILATLVLVSLTLAACGVRGAPQTPPPIWGDNEASQTPTEPTGSL